MEYINFGSTGLKVSRLALGLGLRGQDDETVAQRMIEHTLDVGINLIDCANVYGAMDDRANVGQSERVLGRVLQGRRDRVVVTSKVTSPMGHGPNDWGASRTHIMHQLEQSLRRLNTDYIDVYLIHFHDDTTPAEELVRTLDDIVRAGKVRYIGCCNHQAWQVCRALWYADRVHAEPYMCVQNQYNLLHRGLEDEMFGLIRETGLGAMAYSPLAVSLLTGIYAPDEPPPANSFWGRPNNRLVFEKMMAGQIGQVVATLHEVASDLDKTPAQVAIAWVLSHPEITCAIVGCDTPEQMDDNIGALGWTLAPEHRQRLDEVSKPPTNGYRG